MRREDTIRVRHVIEAAEAALRFAADRRREDLESDPLFAFALARALEILGEAASRVAPETRQALPEIPWTQIVGMRNRLVHAYFDINASVVWKTVAEELPALVPQLHAALAEDGSAR